MAHSFRRHKRTGMHGSQHAGDELVDAIALLDQGHQGRDAAFVVEAVADVGKDQFLEGVDLVLQGHEVGDGLVALVGIAGGPQADVFLVFEQAVELGVEAVELQLGAEKVDVLADQWAVAAQGLADGAAAEGLEPADMALALADGDGVAFLQDLVDGDQRLKGLDFVGHDWLPKQFLVCEGRAATGNEPTHTFMPAQKDREDLWSQV